MDSFGGAYLSPITFYCDTYKNGDFREPEFWKREQSSFGEIVEVFDHTSLWWRPEGERNQSNAIKCKSQIFITRDGLIACAPPQGRNK